MQCPCPVNVARSRWGSAGLSPAFPDFVGILEAVCVPGYKLGGKCLTGFEPSQESSVINQEGLSRWLAQQANWAIFIFRFTMCLMLPECGISLSVGFFCLSESFRELWSLSMDQHGLSVVHCREWRIRLSEFILLLLRV